MAQDGAGGLSLAFECAFAEFGVVGLCAGVGDGGEGRECRELELGGDELAAGNQERVNVGKEFGVLRGPCRERAQGHVDTPSDVGESAGFKERGEDGVMIGLVIGGGRGCGCEFHT